MSFVRQKCRSVGPAIAVLALLVGCGGGGGTSGTPVLPGTGTPPGGGGTIATTIALSVQLLDSNGQPTTAVVVGQPVRARAVLTRNGQPVPGEIVQFSTDKTELVKIDPTAGSQLTASDGTASVTVSSLGAGAGAGRITADSTVDKVAASGAANFFASGSVGSQPTTLSLSGLEIGSAAVSAYGTTGVRVRVLQGGTPYTSAVTVNFTTSCAAGKATITPSASTQPDGYAVATFVDNGCAQTADNTVTITASIGTDTKSTSMIVRAPTAGSLRFLSAVPSDKSITLRGQGGNGRQENAELTFQLVDVAGNGVADADVCFDATTYVGGLNLDGFSPSKLPAVQGSGALCGDTSDKLSIVRYVKRTGADGKVAVQINSGNTPTPVRLRARTLYPASTVSALETYSDTLSISTGLPLQRSFSLSIDKANIDGGNFDGETATLTVRLADQFSNPVPDGTVVNFVASGGAVCTADNGSCKTLNGACSCTFVSQARRPLSNRVVVLAYAVGLEDYNDNNGNNQYDLVGDTFFDLGDAYVDSNMDGIADSRTVNGDTDILIPYQKSGQFSAAGDGVRGTAHIRASTVIYLSQASGAGDPTAVVPLTELSQESDLLAGGSLSSYFVRLTPNCPAGTVLPQATVGFTLDDGIGNPMASGTTLIAADLSDNLSTTGIRPGTVLKVGTRPPVTSIDQPNGPKLSPWTTANANGTVVTGHTVTVRGVVEKCIGDASFVLELASPRGIPASARVLYENEARRVARGRFDVRYRNSGLSFTVSLQARTAFIDMAALVNAAGAQEVTSYTIEWGDGKPVIGNGPGISSGDRTHLYLEAGQKTVTLTVFAAGRSYSARQVLIVQ